MRWLPIITMLVMFATASSASAGLTFKPAVDLSVGDFPEMVASADLNDDGYADLVTANTGSNNVSVLLGGPFGLLSTGGEFTTGTGPQSVEIADFNRDGDLDLAVACISSNAVSVLLGTGTGSFGQTINYPAGTQPRDVTSADFNNDARLDLAVPNGTDPGNLTILLGTGTGAFGPVPGLPVGKFSRSVDTGDFNNDGVTDLVTANGGADNVSVLLGTGPATFGAATNFATASAPNSVRTSDLNNDGKLDLVVANAGFAGVSVLLGTGTGSFGAKTDFPTSSVTLSVAIRDLNGDGVPDLGVTGSVSTSFLIGTGTGAFGAASSIDADTGYSIVATDLDGDGFNDLAVSTASDDAASVFVNSPLPSATPGTLTFGTPTPVPQGAVSLPEIAAISNQGIAPMKVDGFAFTGPDPGDFFIGGDTCRRVIPGGQSCAARVFFSPKAAGTRAATVTALTNGVANPAVSLTGTAGPLPTGPTGPSGPSGPTGPSGPQGKYAALSKMSVSGPSKGKKGKVATYKVKLTNSGNSKATGVRLKASGKGASWSKSVDPVAAGATKMIKVKLRPKKTGKVSVTFSLKSNNAGGKTMKKTLSVKK